MLVKFKKWEKSNSQTLQGNYRFYLTDTVIDDDFDLKATEDYWTWAETEFQLFKEGKSYNQDDYIKI